jgi:Putative zincin peptidase
MKLHNGPPPDDVELDDSWRGIHEPSPIILQVYAAPIAVLFGVVFYSLWHSLVPMRVFSPQSSLLQFGMLMSFPLLIAVHELLHAAVFPGGLFGDKSVIGVWVSKLMFYAHYCGPLSRDRFLLVFAMPFLVISVFPLTIALTGVMPPSIATVAAWFSIWNALFACGDAVGFFLILVQVPRNAVVQNKGWLSFWKPM